MRMKSKLLYVPTVIAVISALGNVVLATPKTATPRRGWTTRWTTAGPYGQNLNGKMFTLSQNRGGISFYPPYFYTSTTSWPSTTPYPTRRYTTTRPYTTTGPYTTTTRPYTTTTRPYTTTTGPYTTTTRPYTTTTRPYTTTTRPYTTTTRPYTTTTRPYTTSHPWTTAPPTIGVSVCLRYLTDNQQASIFTLSPSSGTPLRLAVNGMNKYGLTFDRYSYYRLFLEPNIWFWPNIGPDIWNRVCLTVDTVKNVAQVFSGSSISIRKMLPLQFVWSGEPVIDFPGFDGQVTDVQIWDYPVHYREVFNYMSNGVYGPCRGSVLTWSSISYSLRGNALLEAAYEWQAKQPISRRGRGRQPKGEKMKRMKRRMEFFNGRESEERMRQRI